MSNRFYTPLERYYVERQTVMSMELPWNIKRQMCELIARPKHPLASKVQRFVSVWKDTVGEHRIDEDTTPFGSGCLVDIIGKWCRETGTSLSCEFISTLEHTIWRYDTYSCDVSHSEKRIIRDFYDVCGEYDIHAYRLPAYNNIERLLEC